MAATKNSISSLIAQFLMLQKNSMEIINRLSDAATTTNDTVNIEQLNSDNTTSIISVPSWSYLLNRIKTLDNNVQSLAGLNNGTSNIRNADGSVSKIYQSKPLMDPIAPTALGVPSTFSTRSNWFFDSFLNPLLYVSVPLDGQIDPGTRSVYVKRVILNPIDDLQKVFFDTVFKGRNDVTLDDFLNQLTDQSIGYFADESIVDLPLQLIRYKGNFAVLRVIDQTVTTTNNGVTTPQTIRRYKLDTLTYTDSLATGTNSSRQLKIGDGLITPGGTKYQILDVNTGDNTITLNRINGYDPITIGAGSLAIDSEVLSPLTVDIGVGHDERQGVFIKNIDTNHNVAGSSYSPGICFWSNELTINTTAGVVNLDNFYQNYVSDFSSILLGNSKENVIPSVYSSVPDAPVLVADNFKVLVINTQVTQTPANNKFQTQIQAKVQLQNDIQAINTSISQVQNQIVNQSVTSVSKTFSADTQKLLQKVTNLSQQKVTKTQLLSSTIQDIQNTSSANPEIQAAPIYRVRGFWAFPTATPNPKTGPQEVIQFRIRYRYLTSDGNAPSTAQIPFTDANGTKYTGTFSNWNEYKTDIRKKTYDTVSGTFKWVIEDVSNADTPNVNQLDIPIDKGESVEIKISSISEAGWPNNPAESDFCPSVIIAFPDNLTVQSDNGQYLQQNIGDQAVAAMQSDLSAKGLDTHLATSFTTGNKYYAHSASSITSGFFDSSGNAIDVYQQLLSMQQEIDNLRALLDQAKGVLGVSILQGSVATPVTNGATINLFAGYYNELLDLTNISNWGKIATVTYQLQLTNQAASPLELASLIAGGQSTSALASTSSLASVDYSTNRKYDLTTISLSSILDSSIVPGLVGSDAFIQAPPFQSGNANSQYIYSRYKSVGLDEDLYFVPLNPNLSWNQDTGVTSGIIGNVPSNNGVLLPYSPTGAAPGTANPNIWNGTYSSGAPLGNGKLNEFCIHYQHPVIINESTTSLRGFFDLARPVESVGVYEYPEFRHTLGFELGSNDTIATDITSQIKTYQQMQLNLPSTTGYGATGAESSYPMKLGFSANDEFLVGKYSCGSYLFMQPANHSAIQIEGSTTIASKILVYGVQNSINIPITFQFRAADKLQYIGGYRTTGSIRNITYTKKLGIDIQVRDQSLFSFDLIVSGSYTKSAIATPAYSTSRMTEIAAVRSS